MKIQKNLNGCSLRNGQESFKFPRDGGLPQFVTPKTFLKSSSVTFVALLCPNLMQKLEKTNKRSLIYSKID